MSEGNDSSNWQAQGGDMPPDLFRHYGHQVVDWIADYLNGIERFPVLSGATPGSIASALPSEAPERPEAMEDILHDFDDIILPGITHWNHPAFFGYFAITASAPGILAEMLSAALNVNAMLWRTSPAATELETVTLDWLRDLIGLPATFEGVIYDTASISTLVAIAAARESTDLRVRERGMAGRSDLPAFRLYCSEQAHSSVEKGAITLGIGQENVRKIATDEAFRMDVRALRSAVDEDIAAGRRPFCVVATAGTTSTTSVDPIAPISDVCREHGLWLHVDAAYGGTAAILPEMRWVLHGAELADSLVVNPHKWLFTPVDLSAFYSPRLETVRRAFSLIPEYLRTEEEGRVRDYMNYGPQLGRRFRALKLWFILRSFGRAGLMARLRHHLELARAFASWVEGEDRWEIMAPAPFSTVCFRAHPYGLPDEELDRLNERILDAVNRQGRVFLSHTRLHGKLTLRLAIGNLRTEKHHVEQAEQDLSGALIEALAAEQRDVSPGVSLS